MVAVVTATEMMVVEEEGGDGGMGSNGGAVLAGLHDSISLITSNLPLFGLKQVAVPIIPFSSGFAASLSGHTRWPRRASGPSRPSSAAMTGLAVTPLLGSRRKNEQKGNF